MKKKKFLKSWFVRVAIVAIIVTIAVSAFPLGNALAQTTMCIPGPLDPMCQRYSLWKTCYICGQGFYHPWDVPGGLPKGEVWQLGNCKETKPPEAWNCGGKPTCAPPATGTPIAPPPATGTPIAPPPATGTPTPFSPPDSGEENKSSAPPTGAGQSFQIFVAVLALLAFLGTKKFVGQKTK